MAMTQTLFKGFSSPDRSASETMSRVNDALCDEAQTGMFVTLLYGVLHVQSGALELCNAGHPPPIMISGNGTTQLQGARNPALGLKRDLVFHSASFQLKPVDKLLLYTDGVTEAFNKARELYGIQRLEQFLQKNSGKSVEEISTGILQDVRAYSGQEEASDDLTVLALKITGNGNNNHL
jgi:sigma-B regulation protein RsbU (phosphoserine phosphatase)